MSEPLRLKVSDIKITPDAFKDLIGTLREETKKDPQLKKAYVRTRSRVSLELKKERILAENPEILDEIKRRSEEKIAKRNTRLALVEKERKRREEIKEARHLRIQQELEAKKRRDQFKIDLFNDAGVSDKTRGRVLRVGMFDRRDVGNKLTSIKAAVSYKSEDNKYLSKCEVVMFEESEDKTREMARDTLVVLLIEIDNE